MGVGEEDVFGVAEIFRNFRSPLGQDIQIDLHRFCRVQIFHIGAVPAEGFAAAADFQAAGIDIAAFEDVKEAVGGIVADDADEADRSEEGGGVGEVDGAAADDVVASAEGGFDGVNADGAGD